ncbi:MAG: hypothetical protein V3V78_00405 [Candidatus Woesearchaeota archaeon]
MAKGRWSKYDRANSKILEIIRKIGRHITTNEIRSKLDQNYNIKLAWVTLNNYLGSLEKADHIIGIKIEKKNTIRIWKVKGAENPKDKAA